MREGGWGGVGSVAGRVAGAVCTTGTAPSTQLGRHLQHLQRFRPCSVAGSVAGAVPVVQTVSLFFLQVTCLSVLPVLFFLVLFFLPSPPSCRRLGKEELRDGALLKFETFEKLKLDDILVCQQACWRSVCLLLLYLALSAP